LKIIDVAGEQPADLVILATPVGDILKLLDRFSSQAKLVTDVGSTKGAICTKADRLGIPFIGGHPMAGHEQSGPEAATADLVSRRALFSLSFAIDPGQCCRNHAGSRASNRRRTDRDHSGGA
jgi:prephenate dehydrogenase